MEPFRKGTITEYRRGTHFLTHIEWTDGHEEIEVHQCAPKLMFQSYDPRDIRKALEELEALPILPRIVDKVKKPSPNEPYGS